MDALFSVASFTYLVQPEIAEFLHRQELRLYVVDGQFLCGGKCCGCAPFLFLKSRLVSTELDAGGDCKVYYWNQEQDKSAVVAAEAVAQMLLPHTRHFVRVDMVKCDMDQKWWINEVEDFGADLFFPNSSDGHNTFKILAKSLKNWLFSLMN